MEHIDLKPCPFCGNEASILTMDDYHMAMCSNDECCCETKLSKTLEDAIDSWNQREEDGPFDRDELDLIFDALQEYNAQYGSTQELLELAYKVQRAIQDMPVEFEADFKLSPIYIK